MPSRADPRRSSAPAPGAQERPIGLTVALALAALAALGALAGCDSGGPDGARTTPATATGGPSAGTWSAETRIGSLPSGRKEVSGFVTSPRYPDVAWMIRDSGNPPVLYSFQMDGAKIRSREWALDGVTNGDWEDIAYTTGADGRGRLWILDNINKRTAPKTVYEVVEPDPESDELPEVVGRYRWAYPDTPDGNHDTEVLFALGDELFVVSKEIPSVVYRFDGPLDPDGLNRPVPAGVVNAGARLVLASTTHDERLLLTSSTRTDRVYVHQVAPGGSNPVAFLGEEPAFELQMESSQREAGDFYPWGGCDIVLVSEDRRVWLLRHQP